MLRHRLLAIALTGLAAFSVGVPVAHAQDCYNDGYYAYRYRRAPRSRFVSARRVYVRARPSYAYTYRTSRYYPRIVRTYRYRPAYVVNRFVVYRRGCY
jgi:hypothetical protein